MLGLERAAASTWRPCSCKDACNDACGRSAFAIEVVALHLCAAEGHAEYSISRVLMASSLTQHRLLLVRPRGREGLVDDALLYMFSTYSIFEFSYQIIESQAFILGFFKEDF